MPCYDSRDSRSCGNCGSISALRKEVAELETMLCGLARRAEALPTSANADLITPDRTLVQWWKHHKALDDRKVAMEAAQKERAKLAKRAKAKLTSEEQEALGIRD